MRMESTQVQVVESTQVDQDPRFRERTAKPHSSNPDPRRLSTRGSEFDLQGLRGASFLKEAPNGADDAAGPATPPRTLHKVDSDDEPLSQKTEAQHEGVTGKHMSDPAGDLFNQAFADVRGAAVNASDTEPVTKTDAPVDYEKVWSPVS